jgi:hypothetical protein
MIPAGYMAKRVEKADPKFLDFIKKPHVRDIYSVSNCICSDFSDYVHHWKHNGFWFFNSPEIIRVLANEEAIDLQHTTLFYYEVHDLEFDDGAWRAWKPEPSFQTNVQIPRSKSLEGYDVVAFEVGTQPEHSPLACNGVAEDLPVNEHCLFSTFEEAEAALNDGAFKDAEPGPYRIFAVYSVPWPSSEDPMNR